MDNVAEVNSLGTERMGKLMVRYAVPSVISLVVNALYNIVDQVFIGQGVGYLGNAATNVIMPLTTATIAIGQMIGDGAAAYMSLNLGKSKKELAEKGVGNAISLTIGFGIIFLILFEVFMEPICWLFGATESNIGYSIDAVLIFSYLWGIDGFLWAGPFGDGVSGIISLITIWVFWKKIF